MDQATRRVPKVVAPRPRASAAVEALVAYSEIPQPWWETGAEGAFLNLSWNESVESPSPLVRANLIRFLERDKLFFYPDTRCRALTESLSRYTELPADCIMVFGGSDAALEYVSRAYIDAGDETITLGPTYDNMRVYVESCGGAYHTVRGADIFQACPASITAAITDKTKCVYLVSPNNPTGAQWSNAQVAALCNAHPHSLFVLDEAYFEFGGQSAAPLVPNHANLLVARTFSKAFGLAGLRCGYLLGQPQTLEPIGRIRVGKNVNSLAQVAAWSALQDLDHMRSYVERVRAGAAWLANELRALGYHVHETMANFLLVQVKSPDAVAAAMAAEGVFVRSRQRTAGLERYVRISTAPQPFMEHCLDVWQRIKPEGCRS